MKKYFVLGNDKRSIELKKIYKEENILVDDINLCDILVSVIPFSRDGIYVNSTDIKCDELIEKIIESKKIFYTGALHKNFKDRLEENGVRYYDVLESKSFAILNSIPTAEGAIQKAIEMTDFTINKSNILILGYGNIGSVLAKKLHGIGANVFCSARKQKDIAIIEAMGYNSIETSNISEILPSIDYIFNTIPSIILDEDKIKLIKWKCAYIELASKPYGIDFDIAKKYNINFCLAPGLPSIVAPFTAAKYLKREIERQEKGCI